MKRPDPSPFIIEVEHLSKLYPVGGFFSSDRKAVHAITDVSLALRRGETLAVVGESGCGKSTLARCLMWLHKPSGGRITLNGEDAESLLSSDPMRFRRAVQIVFQDPYASLNPRRTIGQSIHDPLRIHRLGSRAERAARVLELLEQVGLPKEFVSRYPHELSGGQRQRVAIARALAPRPDVIVCDEAVSALDVSVQAQIINLLKDIQAQTNVAYIFITHNLHLVRRIADRIVVMYLGQIVEECDSRDFGSGFLHPYSQALFGAAPRVRRTDRSGTISRMVALTGETPSAIDLPSGCRFYSRCPNARSACAQESPDLRPVAADRFVRCPFA